MYTPGEVSKLLAIPPSTLRRYVALFGEFLSPSARKVRGREFSEADIHLVSRIRDLTQSGVHIEAIPAIIGDLADQTALVDPETMSPETAIAIVRRVMVTQQEQTDRIAALEAQLAELQARLDRPWWKFWEK